MCANGVSLRRLTPFLVLAWLHAACQGVPSHAVTGVDAGAEASVTSAPVALLAPRPQLLRDVGAIEASAAEEGSGPRATERYAAAAELMERLFRAERRDEDGDRALALHRSAARGLPSAAACRAARAAARLAGDRAHDASASYAELHRMLRRAEALGAAGGACAKELRADLAFIAPFAPPQAAIDGIDRSLVAEGVVAASSSTPAVPVVRVPTVTRVEHWPGLEAARIVVVLDEQVRFRVTDGVSPRASVPRVDVDLQGARLGTFERALKGRGIVTDVSVSATAAGARVSLDLDGAAYRREFHLLEPFRVVVDIARHPPAVAPKAGARPVQRVVLDPGHGGNDPGAIGPNGVKEKEVALDVAHRAAPVLASEGMLVALTRDDDRFVSLEERTARANGFGADVFVSIHCNAAETRARRGVETYVLDTSIEDMAGRVASRENATSPQATAELSAILASMRLADQASRSQHLAQLLQRASVAALGVHYPDVLDGGVHTAGFYVLVGARMPAVLFETSYISNEAEEQRLASEDYRQRLGDAIVNAVRAYREGR